MSSCQFSTNLVVGGQLLAQVDVAIDLLDLVLADMKGSVGYLVIAHTLGFGQIDFEAEPSAGLVELVEPLLYIDCRAAYQHDVVGKAQVIEPAGR